MPGARQVDDVRMSAEGRQSEGRHDGTRDAEPEDSRTSERTSLFSARSAGAGLDAERLLLRHRTPRPARVKPTTTTTEASKPACPLTGLPTSGATVPQRPAMAVKVDNYPDGRPQAGLDKADIVFEEPVEGGITRYAAVFQCQDVGLIGPVRSARNIDIGILGQLGNPLIAHVGGINPVLANLNASPIVNVDLGFLAGIMIHPAGQVAPDSDYT